MERVVVAERWCCDVMYSIFHHVALQVNPADPTLISMNKFRSLARKAGMLRDDGKRKKVKRGSSRWVEKGEEGVV